MGRNERSRSFCYAWISCPPVIADWWISIGLHVNKLLCLHRVRIKQPFNWGLLTVLFLPESLILCFSTFDTFCCIVLHMCLWLFWFPVFIGAFCYVIVPPFLQIILHVFLPVLIGDVSVISFIDWFLQFCSRCFLVSSTSYLLCCFMIRDSFSSSMLNLKNC